MKRHTSSDKIRNSSAWPTPARSTENEAKVALAKAQELMTRHNIDSALLRMEHEAKRPRLQGQQGYL